MNKQYWVIGGEFSDTSFRELIDAAPQAKGPFDRYDQALSVWRALTESTRALAHVRYTIAANASAAT